ncbi:hypothetical protein PTKIN_Ptkin19aG0107100 [Pterospermum kingtungense]
MGSVFDQEIQHEISESGLDALKVADVEFDDDGKPRRTGTVWTASAHIITAVIGSGVLSLSWAMAQLGWIAGVGTLLLFSCITYYTSSLLADCYRSPNSTSGKRNYSYMEAVKTNLGGIKYKACGFLQYTFLSGMSNSQIKLFSQARSWGFVQVFQQSIYMIALGIVEIFVSQIPNFHKLSWLSIIAANMAFGYAFIGMGLASAKVISGNGGRTTITGAEVGVDFTVQDKIWQMFTAVTNMAFACAYSSTLIEIQDTLKSSPPENEEMKKANMIGMFTSTSLYLLCCCLGYAAFGNHAPVNMLTGFGFYEPFWVVDLANVFVVVHLVGAYQVVAQPVFSVMESWISSHWPRSNFVSEEYQICSIGRKRLSVNLLRHEEQYLWWLQQLLPWHCLSLMT